MRIKLLPGLLGLSLLGQGCSPLFYVTRTIIAQPLAFNETADKLVEKSRNAKRAKEAWAEVERETPGHAYSDDYKCGFEEGYADYLYFGGNGKPPPLPPRRYWKPKYETPRGHQAVEEWFAGFAHGSAIAQASGYREFVAVPTSAPLTQAPKPLPNKPVEPPPPQLPRPAEKLPRPPKAVETGGVDVPPGAPTNPVPPPAPDSPG